MTESLFTQALMHALQAYMFDIVGSRSLCHSLFGDLLTHLHFDKIDTSYGVLDIVGFRCQQLFWIFSFFDFCICFPFLRVYGCMHQLSFIEVINSVFTCILASELWWNVLDQSRELFLFTTLIKMYIPNISLIYWLFNMSDVFEQF